MSITKLVTRSIESAMSGPEFVEFSRVEGSNGQSLRRYYRQTEATESEISIHRDKWWSKAGGTVGVELFCLVSDYQRAFGGCDQSWLAPDYSMPLCHFQYSLDATTDSTTREIRTAEQASAVEQWLGELLQWSGLPWLAAFESHPGVCAHLERQHNFLGLVKWSNHLQDAATSLRWLKQYLLERPPQLEVELSELQRIGLLSAPECKALLRGSLQEESVCIRRIHEWADSRGV